MSSDPLDLPTPARPRFQFTLKSMLLVTAYFAVLGKACTMLYVFRLKGAPLELIVFSFTWTGLMLTHLTAGIWAWWSLRKLRADRGSPFAEDFFADPLERARRKERRWRFRIAVAWGLVPWMVWIPFLATLGRRDNDWMILLGIIFLHFLPLMLIDAIRYIFWQRRKDDAPVRAMRLAGIAAFMLPAVVVPLAWLIDAL
jgi:hypothetical protein